MSKDATRTLAIFVAVCAALGIAGITQGVNGNSVILAAGIVALACTLVMIFLIIRGLEKE
ncbi:hypothetical protein AB0943_21770 [Streptomyces sp. NPDC007044]|uniref:hypothetical protein n=1 Tax=Streptomyces sp. NPDC007044 TaxID=3156911 RepID=UPI0034512DA0